MAKKNELLNSFSSSRKQKTALAADDIDRIAEIIETSPTPPSVKTIPVTNSVVQKTTVVPVTVVAEEPQQEFVKTSLDFPVDVYEDMKIALFRKRRSMKDYIVELVKQDLYGKK